MPRLLRGLPAFAAVLLCGLAVSSDPLPPDTTYRPLPTLPPSEVKADDEAQKPRVMQRQSDLLNERYDLSNRPIPGVMMSGGRKPVQGGVRVKLPDGVTWDSLAAMSADEIRQQGPAAGRLHAAAARQAGDRRAGLSRAADRRDPARRRSATCAASTSNFDLPDHLTPEFPPPIFLTTHPQLGDVSRGQLLTIRNFYEIMNGIVTPVQMEGLRLLLTPFPQEEFNQTEDRKVAEPSLGVTCLDCHANFHTNAAFHLTPDVRPQAARFRLDTTSLRGMFNQQIHGSKRSLRSVEDFTEFEQRTAYFNGDHVSATRKGVHLPDRPNQVAMMAQMQNIIDFPPAPKLDPFGRLDPAKATEQELAGERVFFGKGRCAECHMPQMSFMDNNMHDLKLERFYQHRADGERPGRAAGRADQDLHACAASRTRRPTCMTAGC